MENPAAEIEDVVLAITASLNPEVQRAAIYKYFAPDASFRHPLCTVPSSSAPTTVFHPSQASPVIHSFPFPLLKGLPALVARLLTPTGFATSNSRETLLRVRKVVYDEPHHELYVEVVQRFHIRWNVFMPAAESRLLTHITLRELPYATPAGKRLYVIAAQEDFYHPEDLLSFVAPLLVPVLTAILLLGTWACVIGAWLGGIAGYWKVGPGEDEKRVELQPVGEHLPPPEEQEISYADKVKQNGVKGRGEAEAEAESPLADRVKEEWPTPAEVAIQEDKE
ncbi:hypothetical protein FOMPIDRAFT_1054886 [Fomitopsis schrenkii]|uniref:SigF-like NTF2-like domain-containing protein n=1 Tax=Fomitopsis schrenkii TaxID=2126942 RepID=S8EYN0_FOMSC|nr:hypothetical protein FOMPIDRAFT_1054886 [Fomitopsis schrenkii]